MSRCTEALDRRFYPGVNDNWDDILFREAILGIVSAESRVLDVGAGAGIVEQMNFKGTAAEVCGIDLDPRVLENRHLDEGKVSGVEAIPYDDASFDVVICDNVLEHLDEPHAAFAEIARVLKPGGVFLFKTPNKYHYMPLIARLTPHWFHRYVNKLRGREAVDTFPTRYRANSKKNLASLARSARLHVDRLDLIEGRPEYTRIFCPLYLIGVLYERLVNATERLASLRILLIGRMSKAG